MAIIKQYGKFVFPKGGLKVSMGPVRTLVTQTLASAGAVTVDASTCDTVKVTLNASASSSSFTNATTGQRLAVELLQGAGGSKTFSWPSNCKFAAGAAPTLSTTAAYTDIVTFIYDGTNWQEMSRSLGIR
jgi:hypothetical protein